MFISGTNYPIPQGPLLLPKVNPRTQNPIQIFVPPLKLSPNPLIVCYEIYYTDITHATHLTRAVTLRDLTRNRCDLWGRAPPPDLLVRESITVREELGPRESVVWDVARSSGDQVVCHAVYQ